MCGGGGREGGVCHQLWARVRGLLTSTQSSRPEAAARCRGVLWLCVRERDIETGAYMYYDNQRNLS